MYSTIKDIVYFKITDELINNKDFIFQDNNQILSNLINSNFSDEYSFIKIENKVIRLSSIVALYLILTKFGVNTNDFFNEDEFEEILKNN